MSNPSWNSNPWSRQRLPPRMAYKTAPRSTQSHSSPRPADSKDKNDSSGEKSDAKKAVVATTTTTTTTTTKDTTDLGRPGIGHDTSGTKDALRTPAAKNKDAPVNPVSMEVHGVDACKGRSKEASNTVTESETGEAARGGRTTDETNASETSAFDQEPAVGPNAKRRKDSSETSDLDGSGEDGDVSGNDDESSSGHRLVDMVSRRKENVNNESRNNEAAQVEGPGAMVVDTTDDEVRFDPFHRALNGSGIGSISAESTTSSSNDGPVSGMPEEVFYFTDYYGNKKSPATKNGAKLLRIANTDIHRYDYSADQKPKSLKKNQSQELDQRLTSPQKRQRTIVPSRKTVGAKLPQPAGSPSVSNHEMETEVGTLKKRKQPSCSGAGNEKDPLVLSDSSDSSAEDTKKERAKIPRTTAIKEDCSSPTTGSCANKATQHPKVPPLKPPKKSPEELVNGKAKKKEKVADKKCQQRELEIGERVYAEFSENKQYYWGYIESKHRRKYARSNQYTVRFDDNDVEIDAIRDNIVALDEFKERVGDTKEYHENLAIAKKHGKASSKPTTVPASQQKQTAGSFKGLSLLQLLLRACGKCEKCKKKDCGDCGACKVNRLRKERGCCFHKMCINIPEHEKLQTTKHLPDHIAFCFLEHEYNPQFEGLRLVSTGGRSYKSVEACCGSKVNAAKVYAYFGLKHLVPGKLATKTQPNEIGRGDRLRVEVQPSRKSVDSLESKIRPYTPRELLKASCGKCSNCTKPRCNECICCRGSHNHDAPDICCFQKMCLKIDLSRKAQPANYGFPEGWKFAFELPRAGAENLNGFLLIPPRPNPMRYFSVESATNRHKNQLGNVNQDLFYKSIGLAKNRAVANGSLGIASHSKSLPSRSQAESQCQVNQARLYPKGGLTPRQLYERRCGTCIMCQKPNCDKCETCLHNMQQTRIFKEVCLQKMCCEIGVLDRVQPAKGFPRGWKFFFCHPVTLGRPPSTDHSALVGLVLVSPGGKRYESVESALASIDPVNAAACARIFYKHVGCPETSAVHNHVLLGKCFRQDWIDVKGNRKVIFGKVTGVNTNRAEGGTMEFIVTLNEKSRALADAGISESGLSIPSTPSTLSCKMAFGACLALNPTCISPDDTSFHWSWLVPDVRYEDFVLDEGGRRAPRLTLQFRSFHIVFTAKQSTIPNAGNGVFVSCSSLTGDSDVFQLKAGELLDFGVYAPFRCEDTKLQHISLLKNFVHGGSCEEWCFDSSKDEHIFDITDDATGKLHALAARHVPAYVNETDGYIAPTVLAHHDPEGAVHYLLGHHRETDGPFTLPTDGSEIEIFVDYGDAYEMVRVRKNYSRLPPAQVEKTRRHLEVQEQIEHLVEFKTFTATEVTQCVDFLNLKVFSSVVGQPVGTVARGMLAAILCRKICERYLDEFSASDLDGEDVCLNGFSTTGMQTNIKKCQKLIHRLFASCNNWAVWKDVFLANPSLLGCLELVVGEHDYEVMPPAALGDIIVGNN